MVVMLNREYALEVLREVVEENGADTTAICSYVIHKVHAYTGKSEMVSECIVGKVLDKLGVPLWMLDEYGDGIAARGILAIDEVREYVAADEAAISALQHAQDTQDNQHNWGVALRAAEKNVSLLPGESPEVALL